ncbi:hypothetical protein GE09DRAFT_1216416 [Coniochaeta sp. 2T2.1]|nr:hypothetical protein GE09DRAFT_1216416 [Coniochaeta sp. 2T2.1]
MWKALRWFYSHRYFTRVRVIQELNVNPRRTLHCNLGFSDAYCWWASTITTELRQPENWLQMLYLASNFSSLDARDVIYGLRGLMTLKHGAEFLTSTTD